MALALVALPLAAQGKQSTASGSTPSGAAAGTTVDESNIPLPGSGATGTATGVAGGAASGAAAEQATGGVSTWDFVRMLLILAAVVGVIYFLFWLLRRGAGKKVQENDLIRVLGSRSLAGSRALHLVEVGSSVYLVGASDGGVELIAEITDKDSLDSVRLKAAEQPAASRRPFQQILSEIFKPAKRPFSVGEGIGILKGQRNRLKKL